MIKNRIHEFAGYLLEGKQKEAMDLAEHAREFDQVKLFSELFTPAMAYVGELWERNEITVADEHVATALCDFILSRLYPVHETYPGNDKTAMLLCLEGEQHYLGLKMVNSVFESRGWDTHYLGPNLPLQYAKTMAEKLKPKAICLSVSIVYHLPKLQEYTDTLSALSHKPAILVGGRLASKYNLSAYCPEGTHIFTDLDGTSKWLSAYELGAKKNVFTQ